MRKIPWKGIAVGCGFLSVLVVIRCAVTAGYVLYYGGRDWQKAVMEDPWLYIGMVAAGLCVFALLALAGQNQKEEKDGRGA